MTSLAIANPDLEKEQPNDLESSSHEEPHTSPKIDDNDLSNFGPAPDGGTRAWLSAAGGFCIFFGCLGFTSCFGLLQQYYSTHQLRDYAEDDIAWIGSISSFIQFSGGAIGGPIFDRYGVWVSSTMF